MPLNIVFLGTPDFSVPALQTLYSMDDVTLRAVVTQPDRPSGRGGKLHTSPVKEWAAAHGVPVIQPGSVRKELASVLSELENAGPIDIAVVVAFGQILPKGMLDFPKHGCLNIHASLLPRWRGAAPIQRAILAGDRETGVCLMQMDEGLDTGGVYSRATVTIGESTTGGDLHDELSATGAKLLARDLAKIAHGELIPVPQPEVGVTYAAKITVADTVINWSLPASDICRQIRAMAPFPGAFTTWRSKRLKIFAALQVGVRTGSTVPGEVLLCHDERLVIACGRGEALLVEDIQLEGKKRMSTADLLRGTTFTAGETLS